MAGVGVDTSRRVCSCGTTLLFPRGTRFRTCWSCQAVLEASPEVAESSLPPLPPPWERSAPDGSSMRRAPVESERSRNRSPRGREAGATSAGLRAWSPTCCRPRFLPATQTVEGSVQSSSKVSKGWRLEMWMLGCVLMASLLVNLMQFALWSVDPEEDKPSDHDGDGVPDHSDSCPEPCTRSTNGSRCATDGWQSGRVTDFDGDGCQDGIEDLDKDNDGVRDIDDHCPQTPMQYQFVSNSISDFDGDGCADGLEDLDNDGDGVNNTVDSCPRTAEVDANVNGRVDGNGCSAGQLTNPPAADPRWWEVQKKAGKGAQVGSRLKTEEAPSEASDHWSVVGWINQIKGAWLEVVLGAVLTTIMAFVHHCATQLNEKIHEMPIISSRSSLPKHPDSVAVSTEASTSAHSRFGAQ